MAKKKAKKAKPPAELTDQQIRFCEEYIVDLNGTQAAIRAGYSENEKSASVQAARLLVNAKVVEKVQALMDARSKRVEVSADTVLRELLRIATVDIGEAYDDEGGLLPIRQIPVDVRRAIAGLEVEELRTGLSSEDQVLKAYTKKLKFCDKNSALVTLARHLKLLTDKTETTDLTLEKLLAASWKPEGKA